MNAWVPPRAVRRVIVDPLWIPLSLLLAVLIAIIDLLGLLLAPLTPPARLPRVCTLALAYLGLDLALLLAAFGLWLRHPSPRREAEHWQVVHCRLLHWALARLLRVAQRLTGFQVIIEPDARPPYSDGPLIVLARHGGPGDSVALIDLLVAELHRRPRVVLKRALQWDPGVDVVLTRLAGCFIPSRSGAGDDQRQALAALAAGLGPHEALLLFPEGGNWTPRRHRGAVRHLLRTGRRRAARAADRHDNVLPPRPAGTVACLLARPDADVLVVAHAGLDTLVTPAQIWQALPVHGRPMRVRWWLCRAADVPREPAAAEQWLQAQWDEVDVQVTALRGPAPPTAARGK